MEKNIFILFCHGGRDLNTCVRGKPPQIVLGGRFEEYGTPLWANFGSTLGVTLGVLQAQFRSTLSVTLSSMGLLWKFLRRNLGSTLDSIWKYLRGHFGSTLGSL